MRRYWRLVAEATGDPAIGDPAIGGPATVTLGATHLWLTDSLRVSVRARR
ncbi:hypothetical protein [Streptomyces roseoviridis]|uniref:Uncharacterized protein n=1 Tax=Streptomyces roseoviridis TaxID=67361 RepID=A0ABV5QX75_9ACTN